MQSIETEKAPGINKYYKNVSLGEWLWLDKTIMDYTYWDEDQPDDGSHGGISTSDGTWKTSDQRFRRPYICKTPQGDPPQHGHIALAVVMSIILIATGAVIAFLLYRKFAHRLSIRVNLNTFDNPLFFSREKSQTGVVDTEKLVENAEEDSPEPVVSVTVCHSFLTDSPFQLTNKNTGFCLVKTNNNCNDVRWTNGDRLLVQLSNKCLGVQGKSVGSEISLHECDENSDLQKWECKNGTLLALKGQEFYIELTADNTAVLSKTVGPNNHLTISGTSSGACSRTYRELFAINGNAAGLPCMFPFKYKDKWYSNCITLDSPGRHLGVQLKQNIKVNAGASAQLQAEASCKQQGASLLSIYDFHQQAFVTALLGTRGNKLWTGLFLDPEHGWKWSNGRPYRYMNWDSGHPLADPGHNCAIADPAVQYSWQSSLCSKKLGYICYSKAAEALPTKAAETGFCSAPWIPYNGHCFNLNRTQKTWPDAQRDCRLEGGDLATIRNVEDQTSTDELWIGLNDRKTEGQFDWIDHSTVSFTSWEFGKPAVSTDIKDCVLIRGENGNWADRVCEEKHGSICMKMSASKPSGNKVERDNGCKRGWRKHGSYCYFIGIQTKTFDEAKDDCRSSNSYLADVSNAVDNAFLVSLVGLRSEKYFWLGLSNQNDIDQFVWTNANSVRFTHWNAEMPGHQQGCVAMTTGVFAGLWDVLPCTNKEKYICKHLAEGAVLTPAPPTQAPLKCADG
ncbi:hypothetical protein F7725_011266 [Dissostichus mawsoni]|uniref:C-type lectin domain-containing protein n=1 Tax=Dissostichus mawsoni TaxID=36200 RepID=A0A7J5Z8J1_DISMA|nr:hypothetical protein F7725_011266 [Dissostichus mawsoni]